MQNLNPLSANNQIPVPFHKPTERGSPVPPQPEVARNENPQIDQKAIESDLQQLFAASKVWQDLVAKGRAEDKDFVTKHSFLHKMPWEGKPDNLNFKLLGMIAAEPFMVKDGEKFEQSKAIDYFISFFENLLKQKDLPECSDLKPYLPRVESFLTNLKACKRIAVRYEEIYNLGRDGDQNKKRQLVEDYAKELSAEFAAGTLDWMPGGWIGNYGDSNPMILKLDKTNRSISFVNTASAFEYNSTILHHFKDAESGSVKIKDQEFCILKNVNSAKFGSEDFFKFLVEAYITPQWDGMKQPTAKIYYEGIAEYLGGQFEDSYNALLNPHLYKTPQRLAGSPKNSITTALYYFMCGILGPKEKNPKDGIAAYNKMKFLWERQALLAKCKDLFEVDNAVIWATSLTDPMIQYLEDIMQNLGREAESLFQKKQLSNDSLIDLHATFTDIRERIEVAKAKQAEFQLSWCQNEVKVNIPQNSVHNAGIRPKVFGTARRTRNYSEAESQYANFARDLITTPLKPITTNDASDSLNSYLSVFDPMFNDQNGLFGWEFELKEVKEPVQRYFERLLTHLPLAEKSENSFWNKVPQSQVLDCMKTIHSLIYMGRTLSGETHRATMTTTMYALLAIMDQLARRLPETCLKENQKINFYGLLEEIESPNFVIENPEVQKQLNKVLAYFEPGYSVHEPRMDRQDLIKKMHESLFNFQRTDKSFKESVRICLDLSNTENLSTDPHLIYMRQFINWENPTFKQKMEQKKITQESHLLDQMRGMLTKVYDDDGHLLGDSKAIIPESVSILQQAVLNCSAFQFGISNGSRFSNYVSSKQLPHFNFSRDGLTEIDNHRVDSHGAPTCDYLERPGAKIFQNSGFRGLNRWDYYFRTDRRKKEGRLPSQEELREFDTIINHDYNRLDQNNIVHLKTLLGLNEEETRHLVMQPVDSYDEVNRTIAFAHRNLSLLSKPLVQDLIYIHLFKTERIFSQLKDRPQFVDQINTFLKAAIDYHTKSADAETSLFLTKIGQTMEAFVKKCGIVPKEPFPNFGRVVLDEIVPLCKNHSFVKKCAEEVISWYAPSGDNAALASQQMQIIAEAYMLSNLSTKLESTNYNAYNGTALGTSLYIKSIQKHWLPLIEKLMKDETEARDRILNKLLKKFNPLAPQGKWNETTPSTYAFQGYQFDITRGTLTQDGHAIVTLPNDILRNADFTKLGIKNISHVVQKERSYVVYPDKIEISIDGYGNIQMSKEIDGQNYSFHNCHELLEKYPTLFNDDTQFWFHSSHRYCLAVNGGKPQIKIGLTRSNAQGWMATSIEREGKWLVPNSLVSPSLQTALKKTGIPNDEIECWAKDNAAQELDSVIFKNLHLSFTVRSEAGSTKLFCKEYPGYFLTDNQYVQRLDLHDKYIVLENRAGEKIVILPRFNLGSFLSKDGEMVRNFVNYSSLSRSSSSPYLEYSVKNGELHSDIVENRLYLSYLFLAKREYQTVANLLNGLNETSAFSDPEKQIFKGMLDLLKQSTHPSSIALGLRIIALLEENRLKFPPSIGQPNNNVSASFGWQTIFGALKEYYQKLGNVIPALRISEEQEKTLLKIILNELSNVPYRERVSASWLAAYSFVSSRIYDIDHKSSSKGPLAIPMPKVGPERYRINSYMIKYDFKSYNPANFAHINLGKNLLTANGSYFQTNFAYFYDLAKIGTDQQRKQLKTFLELNKGVITDSIENAYYNQLRLVCDYPKSYPSVEEIKKLIKIEDESDAKGITKARQNLYAILDRVVAGPGIIARITQFVKGLFSLLNPLSIVSFVAKLGDKAFTFGYYYFARQKWDVKKESLQSTPLVFDAPSLKKIDQTFNHFFNAKLEKFFTYQEVPVEPIAPPLPTDHKNPLVNEKIKLENADLEAYDKSRPKTKRIYSIREGIDMREFYGELEKERERWSNVLKAQYQALLWQANRVPADRDADRLKAIKKDAYQKKVDWEDLQKCFLKGDVESFRDKTHLSDQEIQDLFHGIGDYAIKKSRLDQIKHILKALGTFEKSSAETNRKKMEYEENIKAVKAAEASWSHYLGNHSALENAKIRAEASKKSIQVPEARTNYLLQHLVSSLNTFPAFEPTSDRRAEILFQLANSYFYRKEQIHKQDEILEKLKSNSEILLQMRTGFGKTKSTIPTENIKLGANGDLIVNVWPASIEETNTHDVKVQLKKSSARKVDAIKFDRSTDISEESLEKQYNDVLLDFKEGRPLNLRPETIKALEAHGILLELLSTEDDGIRASLYEKQLEYILTILAIHRTKTIGFIDEARHNFDPKDKLIYTIKKPERLPKSEVELTDDIFEMLTEPPYDKIFNFTDNQQDRVGEAQFNQVRLDLAKHFEKKWKIEPQYSQEFIDFVLGNREKPPVWFITHPKCKEIATLRGQLVFILEVCCKGSVRRNFGKSKLHIKTMEFAIPYISADKAKETTRAPSECMNPHEALDKTYITYLYEGLETWQVVKLVEDLQKLAFKQTDIETTYKNTKANQFFELICPNSKKPLNALLKEDIEDIADVIKKNRKAIFYYVRNIIAPQIRFYKNTIQITTQNMRSQFGRSVSVTATPQDSGAHGPDTLFIPVKGTSGQVRHVFYTKCKEQQSIQQIVAKTNEELRKKALEISVKDPAIRATIDIGAVNKAVSNRQWAEEVCKSLRENQSGIAAVVFYDNNSEREQFMIMDVATCHAQPLASSNIDPADRFTLYDEYRAYGSDVPQDFAAKSLILIGKKDSFTKTAQGGGRMNRTGKMNLEQSPIFGIPSHVHDEIFKGKKENFDDLNIHLLANETEDVIDFNFNSLRDQMDNELRRALLDKKYGIGVGKAQSKENREKDVTKIKVDVKKALKIFKLVERELVSTQSFDSVDMYAYATKAEDTVEYLKRYLQTRKDMVNNCAALSKDEKAYVLARLDRYAACWSDGDKKMMLPPKIKGASSALGIASEVFNEVEVQVEAYVEVEKYEPKMVRVAAYWSEKLDLFSVGWEQPISNARVALQKFVSKVMRFVINIFKAYNALAIPKQIVVVAATVYLAPMSAFYWLCHYIMRTQPMYFAAQAVIGLINSISWACVNYQLKDVLESSLPKNAKPAAKLYSNNFLVTDNFYRRNTLGILEPMEDPFSDEQKPAFQVLAIQDGSGDKKKLTFMAIDQNDSKFFRKKLQKDQETDVTVAAKRSRKVAVVDVQTGKIVSQGKNGFADNELESQAEFTGMMTQAKLLEGEIIYSKDEENFLRKGIESVGKDGVKSYFEDVVLPLHPRHRNLYTSKPIAAMLGKV